jgi:cytochrome P450
VADGGATICGVNFPPGTVVGLNPHVAQRDRSIYGPDADEFVPRGGLM